MNLFNLVIQDRNSDILDESKVWVMSFQYSDEIKSPEDAIRAAVQDYINSNTDESKSMLDYAAGCFNWGDVMSSVPDKYYIDKGLTPLNTKASIEVIVDHDEVLDYRNKNNL